jgi:GTP-binding protein EngB required for normal cell division
MLVTLLGIMRSVRLVQPWNAQFPMLVTLSGSAMPVRLGQPANVPTFAGERRQLVAFHERLQTKRCHLAVLGQFKRGKSSLINALLGAPVLPTAVVPLTSIPTFLHGAAQSTAHIQFDDRQPEERFAAESPQALAQFIGRFVTESGNPKNHLGVRQVNVTYPARVLHRGLVLIDTPGIGSTYRHNTEVTIQFLPQCDAALFVVSADPPITEVEVDFLKLARPRLARIFFVLNKADYLTEPERHTAVDFLQRVLCEQAGFAAPPPVFCVSARQALAARGTQDAALWQASGMAEVEHRIVEFLLHEKTAVLNQAVSRQAGEILLAVERRLELSRRALQLPLADLQTQARLFEKTVVDIEEQGIVLIERATAAEEAVSRSIHGQARQVLPESRQVFQEMIRTHLIREGAAWSEEPTREAIAQAMPGFFEHHWGRLHAQCGQEIQQALAPHRRRAAELVASVHQLVERLFHIPASAASTDLAVSSSEHPYWRTYKWDIRFHSIPVTWVDRLCPRRFRQARIRRRLLEQVEYLVTRNAGELEWSIQENLRKTVADFRAALGENLKAAIAATRGALDAAQRQRLENSAAVVPEVARLDAAIAEIRKLRQRLSMGEGKRGTPLE